MLLWSELLVDSCVHSGLRWLLSSGIQNETGAVFAEYETLTRSYSRVSTEAAAWYVLALLGIEGDSDGSRRETATKTGKFLMERGFDLQVDLFVADPTVEDRHADFFGCGVLLRALLALHRATGDRAYLDCADRCGRAMHLRLSRVDGSFFPHYDISTQQPQGQAASIGQLKIACSFLELGQDAGLGELSTAADQLLTWALSRHESSLSELETASDRAEAFREYAFFLEGLLPFLLERAEAGVALQAGLRDLEKGLQGFDDSTRPPGLVAQLLRLRLFAETSGVSELDRSQAEREAASLAEYQMQSPDPRLDGAFAPRQDALEVGPSLAPHPTIAALQALEFWDALEHAGFRKNWRDLI